MSATSVRHRGSPLGVAVYAAEFVACLVLFALSISLVVRALAKDAQAGFLVSAIGLVVLVVGITLLTGAAVFYQARPVPRPPVREFVAWHPPLVVQAAIVVVLAGATTIGLAVTTLGPTPMDYLLVGTAVLGVWFVGARALVARCEADRRGIRCTTPLTTIRIPWTDLESLDLRGRSVFSQRVVAVTTDGRKRMLWVFDPRIPVRRDSAGVFVAELETVRRSAAKPGA